MSTESQLATAALGTLHGARELPAEDAASRLRDFLNSIASPLLNSSRLAEASGALMISSNVAGVFENSSKSMSNPFRRRPWATISQAYFWDWNG